MGLEPLSRVLLDPPISSSYDLLYTMIVATCVPSFQLLGCFQHIPISDAHPRMGPMRARHFQQRAERVPHQPRSARNGRPRRPNSRVLSPHPASACGASWFSRPCSHSTRNSLISNQPRTEVARATRRNALCFLLSDAAKSLRDASSHSTCDLHGLCCEQWDGYTYTATSISSLTGFNPRIK
jgi:hypothetical protein